MPGKTQLGGIRITTFTFGAPRRLAIAAIAAAMLVGLTVGIHVDIAAADTAPTAASGLPTTVTNDVLATVQIDGIVNAQVTVGNLVYATGAFSNARPAGAAPGTQLTPAGNIVAYNITTGLQVKSFNHTLNGAGKSITASPDGSRIYVGGNFTKVDGIDHNHLIAFDTATGAIDTKFAVKVGSAVNAIAATASSVYVGGDFVSAGVAGQPSQPRTTLAKFSTNGTLDVKWLPVANNTVLALVVAPGGAKVVVGGMFSSLNGAADRGLGAVDPVTGATVTWAASQEIEDVGPGSGITNLTTDGKQIYGAGFVHGGPATPWGGIWSGNQEGPFALTADGAIVWDNNCDGDGYSTFATGHTLYYVSHNWDCSSAGTFFSDQDPEVYHRRSRLPPIRPDATTSDQVWPAGTTPTCRPRTCCRGFRS